MTDTFLVRKRALAAEPKRRSWLRREAFDSSEKLTNQLEEIELGLTALMSVSLTDTGLRPVRSAISADRIAESTGITEY